MRWAHQFIQSNDFTSVLFDLIPWPLSKQQVRPSNKYIIKIEFALGYYLVQALTLIMLSSFTALPYTKRENKLIYHFTLHP
jgi:hypothetical protein